jgi:hypothetical protein
LRFGVECNEIVDRESETNGDLQQSLSLGSPLLLSWSESSSGPLVAALLRSSEDFLEKLSQVAALQRHQGSEPMMVMHKREQK